MICHVQYGEFSAEVVTPRPLPSCEVAAELACRRPGLTLKPTA